MMKIRTFQLPPSRVHGFTLIELVLTLSVTSVLLLSLMSVMRVLGKAVPSGDDAAQQTMDFDACLARLRIDISSATDWNISGAGLMSMRVPDRDGDGSAEKLQYVFDAGTNTLKLSVNDAEATTVLAGVQSITVTPSSQSASLPGPATSQWSSEAVFLSTPGIGSGSQKPDQEDGRGMAVTPVLPADATAWRITRIDIPLRREKSDVPVVTISIHNMTGGSPSPTELQSVTQTLSSAPSSSSLMATFSFVFPSPVTLTPDQRVCFLLRTSTTNNGIEVLAHNPLPIAHANFLTRNSSTSSWDVSHPDESLAFTLFASVQRLTATTRAVKLLREVSLDIKMLDGRRLQVPVRFASLLEVP